MGSSFRDSKEIPLHINVIHLVRSKTLTAFYLGCVLDGFLNVLFSFFARFISLEASRCFPGFNFVFVNVLITLFLGFIPPSGPWTQKLRICPESIELAR